MLSGGISADSLTDDELWRIDEDSETLIGGVRDGEERGCGAGANYRCGVCRWGRIKVQNAERREMADVGKMHIDVCRRCKIGLLKMSGRSRIKVSLWVLSSGAVWSVRRFRPRLGS